VRKHVNPKDYTGCRKMPKLHEVMGRTKIKICCQGSVSGRCVLAALGTVKLGLTEFGNQAKPLKYSEKKLYFIPI